MGEGKQFVDVAVPISDMNATVSISEQVGGVAHILQPLYGLLLFNWHTRVIDFPLQSIGAVELVAGPELDSGQPEWQATYSRDRTGMHHDAAVGVEMRTSRSSWRAGWNLLQDSDRLRVLMPVRRFGGVVQDQGLRRAHTCESLSCGPKVLGQDN